MTIFSQVTWVVQAGVGFAPVALVFEVAPVFEAAPEVAPEVAAVVLETAPGTVAPVIALLEVAAPEVEHEFVEIVTPAFEAAAAPG